MIKYIALYKPPADPEAFDKAYFESHKPLIDKVPAWSARRSPRSPRVFVPGLLGETEPYLIAELYFESKDAMKAGVRLAGVAGVRRQPHRDRRHGARLDVLRRGGRSDSPVTAAVVGGGTMGAGIAHVLLAAGSAVTLAEADAARADAARQAVGARRCARREERGKLADGTARRAARPPVRCGTSVDELPPDAELVIEAVPEDVDLKQPGARRVPPRVPGRGPRVQHLVAVDRRARRRPARRRVIGMHFFNPVPVPGARRAGRARRPRRRQTLARDPRLGRGARQDRRSRSSDSPGFATSRLGLAVGLEAIRMVEEGVASAGGHRHRHAARLRLADGPAAAHRPRRASTCASPIAEHLTARARPALHPAASCCETRWRAASSAQDWPGILRLVVREQHVIVRPPPRRRRRAASTELARLAFGGAARAGARRACGRNRGGLARVRRRGRRPARRLP